MEDASSATLMAADWLCGRIGLGWVMANLGGCPWELREGETASLCAGHLARDRERNLWEGYARSVIECGDQIGRPFRNRDYCNALAPAVLQRTEESGISASWL